MYRIFYFTFMLLLTNLLVAQSNTLNDPDYSSIDVRFNKLRPNVKEFNTAEMSVNYNKIDNTIKIIFTVPNYWLRYKTTLSDYVVIETTNEKITLQNEVENTVAEGSISMNLIHSQNYFFTCSLSKDVFSKLVKDNITAITFCFAPNEDFIKKNLAENFIFDKVVVQTIKLRANNTLKYKASEPDTDQYQKLVAWVNQL